MKIIYWTVISVAALPAILCAGAHPLLDEIREADEKCDAEVATIRSADELKAKQAKWRAHGLAAIGGLPEEKAPLNARTVGVVECDGFRIENIVFESLPGVFVTAHLALPSNPAFKPPYPVVLHPLGHSNIAIRRPFYAAQLAMSARAGFAALSWDPPCQGERLQCAPQFDTPPDENCSVEHTRLGLRLWLVGWNFMRFYLWDAIRAIDYAESRPDLDCSRLGVLGTSGGGTMSAFIQAFDERIKVSAPNCYVSSKYEVIRERGCHDSEQFFWNQLPDGLNHASLLAMGQPRVALAVCSRYKDYFPHMGAVSTFAAFTNMTANLGFKGPYWHFHCDGPHGLPPPTRAAQVDWMRYCILGGAAPKLIAEYQALGGTGKDDDPAAKTPLPFPEEKIYCTPTHQVRDLPGFKSLYSIIVDRASELAGRRKPRSIEEMREIVRRRAAIRPLAELPADEQKPFDHPNFGWWYLDGAYGMRRENEASILATIGRSVVGRDAENIIIKAAKNVKANGGKPVPLVAKGWDCIAAAHAYAAEPQLFSEVRFSDEPPSWTDMAKEPKPGRESYAASVWGALEEYDWTDLVPQRPFGAGTFVLSPRIKRLQDRALDHDVMPAPKNVKYDPADEKLPEPVRIGKRLCEYMSAQPVAIREDEELAGWLPFDGSVESDLYRRTGHKAFGSLCMPRYYIKPQDRLATFEWLHSCGDFGKIVRVGFNGLRREVAASRKKWAGDKERIDYLKGLDLALDGIETRAKNCEAECRRLARAEKDAARKATLLKMADRLEHVPMNPARTFEEGVQSVLFSFDFLSDAIGRLDQYLAPLYFADLKAGRITRERAAERLQELFICIHAHTLHEWSSYDKGGECHMTVGGLTPDGRDGWTEFSALVVDSCLSCNLIRPQMSFRWHRGTKREALRFMLDRERRDPNMRIAFQGDEPHVNAIVSHLGMPVEVARDYSLTGCNEGAFPGGASTGGCKVNAARCIERIFTLHRADALACKTWDDFAALFDREFRHDLDEAADYAWMFNDLRAKDCNVLSALLLSGCIERAKSPTRGGLSRGWGLLMTIGMPNLIDSLTIVKQFVFDERRCTMLELADALAADWKGHEKLLAEIRRYGVFYGENDPRSNSMARLAHETLARFAREKRDYFGEPYTFGTHVGYHPHGAFFGELTGATPDGRHAGEHLSFGSGPASGRGTGSATSILLSVAQMDPVGFMCGSPILNLSVPPTVVTDDGDFEKLVVLVETYFREGGLHIQLNHVTPETLIDAQKHPEKHANLRVRVSGFSGYFVKMRKEIQDEIIARLVASVR